MSRGSFPGPARCKGSASFLFVIGNRISRDWNEEGGERSRPRKEDPMKRMILVIGAAAAMAAVPMAALARVGPPAPAFYVNGAVYRTVATPTDLTGTGAPAHSFDTIYEFFGAQMNVATAAPGDSGYNGGRWIVQGLDWNTSYEDAVAQHGGANGVIDTNSEIAAVLADTDAGGTTTFELKRFVCPVIPG
jgi:hypothetical protein